MSVAVFSVNEVKDEHTGNQKEKSTLQKMDDKRVSRLGTGVNTRALSLIRTAGEEVEEEKKQTLLMMTNFTADFSLETNTKTKTVAVTVERQCVCI